MAEQVLANKQRFDRAAALALARKAEHVVVARGKKVVRFRMADKPSDDELAAVLLGPSGNLRAPALRVGKTLIVGFSAEAYEEVFG